MSGICGWDNSPLTMETGAEVLEQMLSRQSLNPGHTSRKAMLQDCAVAAAGPANTCGVQCENGLAVAIQGAFRWADEGLAETAARHGQAQAVMEAYRRQGTACLRDLNGPFALCIIDKAAGKTLLAIDRLGIGSLFFSARRGQLIFASNARAIQRHPGAAGGLNPQGVFDYLYFHMVPGPRSIFNDVEKLLPGQCLLIENGRPAKEFYWQPEYKETANLGQGQLEAAFREIVKSAVGRAAEGAAAGAFLSGGTDSSTVAGMLRGLKGAPIDTYSIGFDAEGFDEMHYARVAARHFGTRAHEYYVTPQDVADAIPLIAKAYDEPFGNASAVPVYYCAKMARADGVETLLAGDGGDELFGGNERYAKQKIFEYYHSVPPALRRSLIEPVVFGLPMADKIWPLAKAQSYIRQAGVPLPDRLETYNFLVRTPLAEIFDPDFLGTVNADEPLEYLRETYRRARADSPLNRMLFLDLKFTLADSDLRKVNRMCELAGVEVRYPLLDQEVLDFSAQLPTSLKLRGLKLRYFFKKALQEFLPEEILAKSKHGFGLPFGLWMKAHEPLRELSHENLASISQRGIIRPDFIDTLRQRHSEHPSYHGVMIWVLIMLEQWLRT